MTIQNLVLIGPRASGKSKTAKRIHKALGFDFISTDVLIYYEEGLSILEIVARKGWPYFREVEYNVLKKVSKLSRYVIDCGGGIVIDLDKDGKEIVSQRKIEILKNLGFIVFLKAESDYVYQKVADDSNRPALTDAASFASLMAKRNELFSELCDISLETTGKKGKDIAKEILPKLEDAGISIQNE